MTVVRTVRLRAIDNFKQALTECDAFLNARPSSAQVITYTKELLLKL